MSEKSSDWKQQLEADMAKEMQLRRQRAELLGIFATDHWMTPFVAPHVFCAELIARYPRQFLVAHDDLLNALAQGGRLLTLNRGGSWSFEDTEGVLSAFGKTMNTALTEHIKTIEDEDMKKELRQCRRYLRTDVAAYAKGRGRARLDRHCGQALNFLGDEGRYDPDDKSPDRLLTCSVRQLDTDTHWLGAPNGVIDLKRGYFQSDIDKARQQFVVGTLPDEYNPAATSPYVDKLLSHLHPDVKLYLLQSINYALRGYPSRRFLILKGDPGGGKSTLCKALEAAFGMYAGTVSEDAFTRKRGNSAGLSPSIKSLVAPRRLAFITEANKASYDTEKLKTLSGDDNVRWRDMYQSERTDRVTATVFMVANDMPSLDATDTALLDRMVVLPYPAIPPEQRDAMMISVFGENSAAGRLARQALVAEIVRAGADMHRTPKPPQVVLDETQAATDDLLGEVGAYVIDRIETANSSFAVSSEQIWTAIVEEFDVDKHGRVRGMNRRQITRLVSHHIGQQTKQFRLNGKVVRGWKGIKWTSN